jgi:hypothetical protein
MSVKAHYNVKEHHLDIQTGPFRMIILPPMLHPETKKTKTLYVLIHYLNRTLVNTLTESYE